MRALAALAFAASCIGAAPEPPPGDGLARAAHEGALANYSGLAGSAKTFLGSAFGVVTFGLGEVVLPKHETAMFRAAHHDADIAGKTTGVLAAAAVSLLIARALLRRRHQAAGSSPSSSP